MEEQLRAELAAALKDAAEFREKNSLLEMEKELLTNEVILLKKENQRLVAKASDMEEQMKGASHAMKENERLQQIIECQKKDLFQMDELHKQAKICFQNLNCLKNIEEQHKVYQEATRKEIQALKTRLLKLERDRDLLLDQNKAFEDQIDAKEKEFENFKDVYKQMCRSNSSKLLMEKQRISELENVNRRLQDELLSLMAKVGSQVAAEAGPNNQSPMHYNGTTTGAI